MKGLLPRLNIHYSFFDAMIALKSLFVHLDSVDVNLFYVNHARTGLRIALTSLNLPKGSKVGVLVYNCYTVMNAVKLAGCELVFIDMNDSFSMDLDDLKMKKGDLSAIIVTHLFGVPNEMDKIKFICPDIPIIEDCAHAFMSKLADQLLGSFGDLAVFSMGQGKFPSIADGGYLVVNNNKYLTEVQTVYQQLPKPHWISELFSVFKNLLLSFLHKSIVYKYFTKPFLKNKNHNKKTDRKFSDREGLILKTTLGLFLYKSLNFQLYLEQNSFYP